MAVEIENKDMESGLYLFQLQNNNGIAGLRVSNALIPGTRSETRAS
ncbi:MAG: hypothetical protein NT175_03375 [Bacteroidetes bacterium]|nr:hypothetical protein [Bacteroidota bacterium]